MALRSLGAILFIVGGGSFALISLLGVPSFWYGICLWTLPVIGVVWVWQPCVAAALSIGPLISVAALLQYGSGMWAFSLIAGLAAAVVLVFEALRGSSRWQVPVIVSLGFVTMAFATDRLFTNKVAVRTYDMYVAIDGRVPWGDLGRASSSSPPIVLYRRVDESYCYDAFRSNELRQRLGPKNGSTVRVEYNIFSDFGKERSYNVRSVDGLLLADGQRTVRDFERFGGQILGTAGLSTVSCQ
jgi:hypothetical protein